VFRLAFLARPLRMAPVDEAWWSDYRERLENVAHEVARRS
jgi:hypothetical protein